MIKFSRTVFDPNQKEIARVNRVDGTLYLKPQIWDTLPQGEKDFVLYHEQGHLVLQTTDEYKANAYAVKNYLPSHTLSNPELKARITVMQSILTPGREDVSGFNTATSPGATVSGGFDPVSAVAGAIGSVFTSLPMLGIGSGARQKEIAAQGAAQASIINAQATADGKKSQNYIVIGILAASFVVVGIVLYFIFKKR